MSIYLDDESVELPGNDLDAVLKEVRQRLVDSGRIVVEIQRDGQAIASSELDSPQDTPIGHSEWRLYTAEPRELAVATLRQVPQRLSDAQEAQAAAADLLQQDRPADAMTHVAEAVEAWQQAQQAMLYSATLVGIELDGKSVDGEPVSQTVSILLDQLKELRELIAAGDTIGMADALAYEWPRTVERWQALIGQMIDWVSEE